jgi:hypothetical protein
VTGRRLVDQAPDLYALADALATLLESLAKITLGA